MPPLPHPNVLLHVPQVLGTPPTRQQTLFTRLQKLDPNLMPALGTTLRLVPHALSVLRHPLRRKQVTLRQKQHLGVLGKSLR